jgi:arabinose-5-phosphate isomerase
MSSSSIRHSDECSFVSVVPPSSISEATLTAAFGEQRRYVNHFFDHVDMRVVKAFADVVLACTGVVYLTGMGKSGIIARNISMMFVSVGVRAMYMSPVDALHGDVGILRPEDVLVLLSKTGATAELLALVPAARRKGVRLVALVCDTRGPLAAACDPADVIALPLEKELCPFDLAPTTSSIIQLIFGNTVVAAIMNSTNLTREQYAANHPAGRIGKRLTVLVADVMRPLKDCAVCGAGALLLPTLALMSSKRSGAVIVCDDAGSLLGIFTDGDLRRTLERLGNDAIQQPLGALMKRGPATCRHDQKAFDAMQEMERTDAATGKKRVKELPVVDDTGRVVGLITLHDLVQYGL